MRKLSILLVMLSYCTAVSAQGEAAVPFLVLQQSTMLYGAGQIGAAVPTADPAAFYFNPAQLGNFSGENNLAVSFMPVKNRWMPNLGMDYSFQSYGAAVGYNFRNDNVDLPLSIGIGYIHSKLDFGQYLRITPYTPDYQLSHNDYDAFDCFSIGAAYKYFLQFNLGFSFKSFESVIGNEIGIGPMKATGSAFDFGFMITAPVSELLFGDVKYDIGDKSFIKPVFDFTLGYSVSNLGKEIYYKQPEQSDPIPRTARLGYTLNFGIDLFALNSKFRAVDYSFTAEAEDILITRNEWGNFQYQGMLGDINIANHLIELKKDDKVVVHKGHIFRLFDTVIITSGVYDGRGYNHIRTNGFGLSSEGIFRLLCRLVDNAAVNYIAGHFSVEYFNSNIFVDSGMDTNLKGVSIYFRGIEF